MNGGLNQYSIYMHNSDFGYEFFITVTKEACRLFDVKHYYLLMCTPEGNLVRFMIDVSDYQSP